MKAATLMLLLTVGYVIELDESASCGCGACALLLNGIRTLEENYGLISLAELLAGSKYIKILLEEPSKERTGSQSLQVLLQYNVGTEIIQEFNLEFFVLSKGLIVSSCQL
jgi:hypothetical protein